MTDLLASMIGANNVIVNAYSKWEEGARLQNQANAFYKTRKQDLTTRSLVMTAAIFIASGFAFLLVFGGVGAVFDNSKIVMGALSLCPPVALGGAAFGYARFVQPSIKKEETAIKSDFDMAMARAKDATQAGNDIIQENISEIIFLPDEYCYPLATGYMVKCIQQGRAATLQEAMDKFDEQLHRWTLEANQQEMLHQQRIQMQQLNQIRQSINFNTAVTAAGFATEILTRL